MTITVPVVEEGSLCDPDAQLVPGVLGYAIATERGIYVPDIRAECEGDGRVGRFLTELGQSDQRVAIPNVISPRLEGMLRRRGWRLVVEDWANGEPVDVWESPGTPAV